MEACSHDIQAYFRIAVEFHQELALATKNKLFYPIWEIFHDILLKGYIPILEQIFPEGPSKFLEVNKILLTAIRSRDPDPIAEAMEIHAEEERFFTSHYNMLTERNINRITQGT